MILTCKHNTLFLRKPFWRLAFLLNLSAEISKVFSGRLQNRARASVIENLRFTSCPWLVKWYGQIVFLFLTLSFFIHKLKKMPLLPLDWGLLNISCVLIYVLSINPFNCHSLWGMGVVHFILHMWKFIYLEVKYPYKVAARKMVQLDWNQYDLKVPL